LRMSHSGHESGSARLGRGKPQQWCPSFPATPEIGGSIRLTGWRLALHPGPTGGSHFAGEGPNWEGRGGRQPALPRNAVAAIEGRRVLPVVRKRARHP